jgi:hypothetical protein
MQDFWRNSGFHLLERDGDGRLSITDDFLRAYLMRPEIRPVEESGANEIGPMKRPEDPRRNVDAQASSIEDEDARDNYRVLLAFSSASSAPRAGAVLPEIFSEPSASRRCSSTSSPRSSSATPRRLRGPSSRARRGTVLPSRKRTPTTAW